MQTIPLKYGCNPNQKHAQIVFEGEGQSPVQIVNGTPSMINLLDGIRGWQLVRELAKATGKPAAASYKHVSPAGAAVSGPISPEFLKAHLYATPEGGFSPLAAAYARARSSDRSASFGDFVCLSDTVDKATALLLKSEVSDGIIAPGYEPEALEILKAKKKGAYVILKMDPAYAPPATEHRIEFGIKLEQSFNDYAVKPELFTQISSKNKDLPQSVIETLLVATITLKHTQSNTICVAQDGHAIGIGAGQQSRIACTRLACAKADIWLLKQHPKTLALKLKAELAKPDQVNTLDMFVRWHELNEAEQAQVRAAVEGPVTPITPQEREAFLAGRQGLVLSSDAFIPFRDNLDRAAASGVKVVAHAGGSARDEVVIEAADQHHMVLIQHGVRFFLH